MNPFARANLKFNAPTIDVLEMTPEEFEGAYRCRVLVHGGDAVVERVLNNYTRGRMVFLRGKALMVVVVESRMPASAAGHPGSTQVTFRAMDLAVALDSLVPDDGTGKKPITFAEKIAQSVEPKFGVMGKRRLLV